jgi:hypothetical protein
MISNFSELLKAANEQDQPQRLLLLFTKAENTSKKEKETQQGTLSPVMCVDKLPEDITSFAELSKEADNVSKDWDFIFAVGLSGHNGLAPTEEEAEPFLNKMTNDITSGQNIAQYAIFDRTENPVMLQAN